MDNFSPLSSIHSSPVVHVLHKSLRNTIRSSENPQPSIALEILACIMINPISLEILLAPFVIIFLSPLIQYVANARNPQSDPRIHPFGSNVILNLSWISTNQIVVDFTPKLTQLMHP